MRVDLENTSSILAVRETKISQNQVKSGLVICGYCETPMAVLATREGNIHKLICTECGLEHAICAGEFKTLAVISRVWVR